MPEVHNGGRVMSATGRNARLFVGGVEIMKRSLVAKTSPLQHMYDAADHGNEPLIYHVVDALQEAEEWSLPSVRKLVCSWPKQDWSRLVEAFWYEQNSDADRAEFVRVQCELAGLEESGEPCDID